MRKISLKKEYDRIYTVGTMPGILFGNPKVHEIPTFFISNKYTYTFVR